MNLQLTYKKKQTSTYNTHQIVHLKQPACDLYTMIQLTLYKMHEHCLILILRTIVTLYNMHV